MGPGQQIENRKELKNDSGKSFTNFEKHIENKIYVWGEQISFRRTKATSVPEPFFYLVQKSLIM